MNHADDGHRPLVAFTTLAIGGAGALAVSVAGVYGPAADRITAWAGLALIGGGLALSTWHLGRRDRALFAARGLFRSPISNEGALGALTVALGVVTVSGVLGTQLGAGLRLASGILAFVFLASIGLVYRLGGQLTWTGFSSATPLTAGLAFGAIFADSLPPPHQVSTLSLGLIALDAFVFSQRWRHVVQVALEHGLPGPWFDRRHELLAARFLLLNALPCLTLFVWPTPLAAAIAGAGLVVDRVGFYALGLQRRTEVEIDRVERLLDGR